MALGLLTGLIVVGPACAESASATVGASTTTQAAVDFRIVIPETVRMGATAGDQPGRAHTFTSRTTEVHGDRIVVTIAKP